MYRYRYMGSEGRTAAWLSADRFAVLDLAAGRARWRAWALPSARTPRVSPPRGPSRGSRRFSSRTRARLPERHPRRRRRRRRRDAHPREDVRRRAVGGETRRRAGRGRGDVGSFAARAASHHRPSRPRSFRAVIARVWRAGWTSSSCSRRRGGCYSPVRVSRGAGTHNLHEHEHLAAAVLRARRAVTTAGFGDATRAPRRGVARASTSTRRRPGGISRSADLLASGLTDLGEDASARTRSAGREGCPTRARRAGRCRATATGARARGARRHACGSRVRAESRWASPGTLVDGESLVAAADDLVVVVQPVGDPRSPRRARTIRTRGDEGNRRARPSPPRNSRGRRRRRRKRRTPRRRRRTPAEEGREATTRRRGKPRASKAESVAAAARSPPRASRHPARRRRVGSPSFPLERPRGSRATFGTHPTRRRWRREGAGGLAAPHERQRRARPTRGELVMVRRTPSLRSFTNCTTLSAALADVARRNAVSRAPDTALRAVRRGLAETEQFADAFLKPPSPTSFPSARTTRGAPTTSPRPPRRGTGPENPNRRGWIICTRIRTARAFPDRSRRRRWRRWNGRRTIGRRVVAAETRCTTAT